MIFIQGKQIQHRYNERNCSALIVLMLFLPYIAIYHQQLGYTAYQPYSINYLWPYSHIARPQRLVVIISASCKCVGAWTVCIHMIALAKIMLIVAFQVFQTSKVKQHTVILYSTKLWQWRTLVDCCPKIFWQKNIGTLADLNKSAKINITGT